MFDSSIKSTPFFHLIIKSLFILTGDDDDYSEDVTSSILKANITGEEGGESRAR